MYFLNFNLTRAREQSIIGLSSAIGLYARLYSVAQGSAQLSSPLTSWTWSLTDSRLQCVQVIRVRQKLKSASSEQPQRIDKLCSVGQLKHPVQPTGRQWRRLARRSLPRLPVDVSAYSPVAAVVAAAGTWPAVTAALWAGWKAAGDSEALTATPSGGLDVSPVLTAPVSAVPTLLATVRARPGPFLGLSKPPPAAPGRV